MYCWDQRGQLRNICVIFFLSFRSLIGSDVPLLERCLVAGQLLELTLPHPHPALSPPPRQPRLRPPRALRGLPSPRGGGQQPEDHLWRDGRGHRQRPVLRVWGRHSHKHNENQGEVWWSIVFIVPASRPPVPGSNLGPGPLQSTVKRRQIILLKPVKIKQNPRSRWAVNREKGEQ